MLFSARSTSSSTMWQRAGGRHIEIMSERQLETSRVLYYCVVIFCFLDVFVVRVDAPVFIARTVADCVSLALINMLGDLLFRCVHSRCLSLPRSSGIFCSRSSCSCSCSCCLSFSLHYYGSCFRVVSNGLGDDFKCMQARRTFNMNSDLYRRWLTPLRSLKPAVKYKAFAISTSSASEAFCEAIIIRSMFTNSSSDPFATGPARIPA